MFSFTDDIRAYYAYTKRIDFLFFRGFVFKPKACGVSLGSRGQGMSSVSWKIGEKTVISEERVARSLYYYAKFQRRYTGLLFIYETY